MKPTTESGSSFLTRCFTSHRGPSPNIDQDLATGVGGDWINDYQYRDTIGLINWEAITANTWRWAK